jgi:hypothetical protein
MEVKPKRSYIKSDQLTPEQILERKNKRTEYMRDYMKRTYEKNKDKIIASVKKHQEQNKEKKKEYSKKYYEENKEEYKERTKRHVELINLINKINQEKVNSILELLKKI